MSILDQLSSAPLYLISGVIILYVLGMGVFFLIRAYKAGVAIGMDKVKLRRTITSSVTFSILPSVSILLGVIALSGTLGLPLPWLRLMTARAFTTIALLMTVGIIWGVVCVALFGKKYHSKLQRTGEKKSGGRSFGDDAMTAMFIGLITAYMGSYVGTLVQLRGGALVITGEYLPLVTMAFAALAMWAFTWLAEKKKMAWLENFSIAGSMLVGMAAAVICNMIF